MSNGRIIKLDRVEENPVEPITLAQAKKKLIITSSDDDTFITDLLTSCRQMIENSCNISICSYEVTLIADIYKEYTLPYAPFTGLRNVSTRLGNEGSGPAKYQTLESGWVTDGDNFIPGNVSGFNPGIPFTGNFQWGPYATEQSCGNRYLLIYTTGMVVGRVPKDLCDAILAQVVFDYEHRGEEYLKEKDRGLCPLAEDKAGKYRVQLWL